MSGILVIIGFPKTEQFLVTAGVKKTYHCFKLYDVSHDSVQLQSREMYYDLRVRTGAFSLK